MLSSVLLFLNIGGSEMMLILLVALFLFGGKKLPELARGLGRGIREFKDASESIKRDINDQINNFGKDLDVSESNSGSYAANNSSSAPTDQHDYSDGGNRQPDYYGGHKEEQPNAGADVGAPEEDGSEVASTIDLSKKPEENSH